MFRFRRTLPLLFTALVAGCATGMDSSALTAPRIYEACMAVEVPKTQEKYRQEGKPADEAKMVAHFICKVTSGICAENPTQGSCPDSLRDYGLLK